MSKYECIVCGLIYDEKEGWPDDGIAPGTRWADVPEDWLCPDCGVGKEDFELLEEAPVDDTPHHEEPVVDKVHSPVVILGTGLAGYGLAKEFRKHDDSTPLILITSDDGRSYSKPMLSTGYTKNHSANDLAQLDAGIDQGIGGLLRHLEQVGIGDPLDVPLDPARDDLAGRVDAVRMLQDLVGRQGPVLHDALHGFLLRACGGVIVVWSGFGVSARVLQRKKMRAGR